MNKRLGFVFALIVIMVAVCNCFLIGLRSPKYDFQPGQEMSLAKKYDEGDLPVGANEKDVVPMGETFRTLDGHEIKLMTEYSGGVIDINIKFAGDPEKTKFQINTAIENKVEWENFVIIPFLRGAEDGKYHFWLYVVEK